MSQISADVLPTATEQLALIAPLGQRANAPCAPRLGMAAVLFKHQRELLPDELGTRHSAVSRGACEQMIGFKIERDGGRFLSDECHRSNMTRQLWIVNALDPVEYS